MPRCKFMHNLPYEQVSQRITELEDENAELRKLAVALYHIHFGSEEESWDAWEDFCPCGICEERHGGEAPCAYTARDLADECCEPITKEIVTNRMRELGVGGGLMLGVRKAVSEFADAFREILREIERLRDENAKLREAAERDADVMEALNLSLEESQADNAKLMELCKDLYGQVKTDDSAWEIIRRREDELPCYADHLIAGYDCSLGKVRIADGFADRMRELGIEVD